MCDVMLSTFLWIANKPLGFDQMFHMRQQYRMSPYLNNNDACEGYRGINTSPQRLTSCVIGNGEKLECLGGYDLRASIHDFLLSW